MGDFVCAVDYFAAEQMRKRDAFKQNVQIVRKQNAAIRKHARENVGNFLSVLNPFHKDASEESPSSTKSVSPLSCPEDNLFFELGDLIVEGQAKANDMKSPRPPVHSPEEKQEMQSIMSFINETDPEKTDPEPDKEKSLLNKVKAHVSEKVSQTKEDIKDGIAVVVSAPIDELVKDRWVAGMFKPMLPEYPDFIQFWTEMNHRYGDLMMQQVERYNYSEKFREEYYYCSIKARKYECINTEAPYELLPHEDVRWAPNAAVPTRATTFIIKEITKMGGRTHYYLKEFYDKQNKEMASKMHSSIYPGAGKMDMKAMVAKTNEWRETHKLP